MARNAWIILFEDTLTKRQELEKLISKEAKQDFKIHSFDADTELTAGSKPYEDQLAEAFSTASFKHIALFVTDRDLSTARKSPGLSEAAVSKAAAMLGLPVCVYAAGAGDSVLERQRSGGDGRIILDSRHLDKMAHRIAVLARGFEDLAREVTAATKAKSKTVGPGAVLARALGHPEVSAHIALYTSGDQRMIVELMPAARRPTGSTIPAPNPRRMTTALGTWLYDSVLRFPGVLVDTIAGASFLNIAQARFQEPRVRGLFKSALYEGPFADEEEPRWWRHKLADMLEHEGVPDGRALAEKRLGKTIPGCACSVDGKTPAGYVCAVTLKPVCDEHSVGAVGWLPRGANLTRVTRSVYDDLTPWIGVS